MEGMRTRIGSYITYKPVRLLTAVAVGIVLSFPVSASDHLDAPTVITDPATDIGDLYAWMSPDGLRLNLVMNIVGKRFSDKAAYVFHIDSGRRFGRTTTTMAIECRFDVEAVARCEMNDDRAVGLADRPEGIESERKTFRVFAGLRDDPFANNVRGTQQAYGVVERAMKAGAPTDISGCPALGNTIAKEMLDRWRHTEDGPAKNFLAGWETGALVVSVDISAVDRGGATLAIWAGTYALAQGNERGPRMDRMGRTLTGNALLGLFAPKEDAARLKEQYNRAAPSEWIGFAPEIQKSLALYDSFDGVCGNQWLASRRAQPGRYRELAKLLADDRLWVDSRRKQCTRYMAVERRQNSNDCGGRTPEGDAVDLYRSLLIKGTETGVEDGILQDDKMHSTIDFPFLAEP